MKSSNPVLKEDTFQNTTGFAASLSEVMTIQGTINKCLMLSLILVLAGAFSWSQCTQAIQNGNPGIIQMYMYGGLIGGLIFALITVFKKDWSPFTSLLYAGLEGLFLGAISWMFESSFPGIVQQATLCTVSTLFGLLFLYKTGVIKVTEKFRSVIFAATAGIAIVYLANFVLGFFGVNIPFIHESGLIGIGFSAFVTIIAALNLLLDFDFIDRASSSGNVPKYMEWYAAFGLMVTLVWLYLEMLRLLSKLIRR